MREQFSIRGIDEGEPLMSEDNFELRLWGLHSTWNSVITHVCGDLQPPWIAPLNGKPNRCPYCKDTVPQNVVTAWILHNFEEIQRSKV